MLSCRGSSCTSMWISLPYPPPYSQAILKTASSKPLISAYCTVEERWLPWGPTRSRKVFSRRPQGSTCCGPWPWLSRCHFWTRLWWWAWDYTWIPEAHHRAGSGANLSSGEALDGRWIPERRQGLLGRREEYMLGGRSKQYPLHSLVHPQYLE